MVRNILFVDDDQILCNAVEKSLARHKENFTVVTACDGFDAVKKLPNVPVSLVILELIMPRMDGMSLIKHLSENYPDLPAIVISSIDDAHLREITKQPGIIGYFKKPLQAEKLAAAINMVLQKEAAGGIMHDISPTVFLQLMEMDAKSCTIRILDNATGRGGILYFKDGELLDARIGQLRGITAAYEVFSWDTATIFIRNECEPRKNIINSELTPIIMKAVGMKDEAEGQTEDDGSDSAHEITDSKQARPANSARIELLKKSLGDGLGLKKKYPDTTMSQVAEQLKELGKKDDFGEFSAAYITSEINTRIILSGQPPTVLEVDPSCPSEKIIDLLKSDSCKT